MWNNFIRSGLKVASPVISAAVAAKTKKPQAAQATSKFFKSISGGKILSVADVHGSPLILGVL